MFQLEQHHAVIGNVNFRKENHGDEKVAAVDIKFETKSSSTLLDSIDPELRNRFFKKPGRGEQQTLPIDGNDLTALAMPMLGEQKIGHEFECYEVELEGLLDHVDPVFFADAKIKKLSFTPIEGGSIEMSLTISTRIEDDDDAPLLAAWRRGECRLSLTPPSREQESDAGLLENPERAA